MAKTPRAKKERANRVSVRIAVIVTLILVAVLALGSLKLYRTNQELLKNKEALSENVASEQAKNEELKEKDKALSESEILKLARKWFGLVFPNEILFVPETESGND